jgi:hypothetical protein
VRHLSTTIMLCPGLDRDAWPLFLTTIRRLEHHPNAPCRSRTLVRLAAALHEEPAASLGQRHGIQVALKPDDTCSSTYCGELIDEHGQALVVEGWAQPPGLGECRQAMKTAPGDLGERLCVAVASQRRQRLT